MERSVVASLGTVNMREQVFHEEVFYAYFKPFRHPSSHFNIWGGHGLETFGDDLAVVKSVDVNCIWTVVEGDACDDLWITPGLHFVNRICYLVTQVPHADAPIAFRAKGRQSSITPIGLARRITMLRKLMQAHAQGLHQAY